jgi:hypothetical protein
MPGFYREIEDSVEWKSFAFLSGSGSIEMSMQESEILCDRILPRLKQDLLSEGCDPDELTFEISTCRPKGQSGYGQIMAKGCSPRPIRTTLQTSPPQ